VGEVEGHQRAVRGGGAGAMASDGVAANGRASDTVLDDRVFDQAHFAMMTAEDAALQVELIGLFREQALLWRRLLIPDAPTHTWRDAAHSVKGTARGLGLWALAEACENVEALAQAGAVEGRWVSEQLARVRGRLEEALGALKDEETKLMAA
jgi:hypothetical protein